eukprot:jgi/Hompol1/5316/HPOL_000760-RA
MSLQQMPVEINELIFLASDEHSRSVLAQTCKQFRRIGSSPIICAKALLWKHAIWSPFCAIAPAHALNAPYLSYSVQASQLRGECDLPLGRASTVATDQWLALVHDHRFTGAIGLAIFHLRMADASFSGIASEFAAIDGNLTLILWLIDHGRLTQKVIDGTLVQACMAGNAHLLLPLIDLGHASLFSDNGAALSMAAKYGHLKCVQILLDKGASVDADDGYALCWAARNGHNEIVYTLIQHGANVNIRGGCPLNWAAEHGHESITLLLIDSGANIHANDEYALRWSSVRGKLAVVKLLLQKGADVHAVQDFALRNAVKFGHPAVVKALLAYHADPRACDDEAFKWAATHGNQVMLEILVSAMQSGDNHDHESDFHKRFLMPGQDAAEGYISDLCEG